MIFLALSAGFFAGASLVLTVFVVYLHRLARLVDTERRIFINKSFVRDGSQRVFPENMINPQAEPSKPPVGTPKQVKSPFWSGIFNKEAEIKEEKRKESGTHLPADVREAIKQAAAQANQS